MALVRPLKNCDRVSPNHHQFLFQLREIVGKAKPCITLLNQPLDDVNDVIGVGYRGPGVGFFFC